MNLLPTQEQRQIVDTIRDFLREHAPVERLRPDRFGQVGNPDAAVWPLLAELGFLGFGAPEDAGGLGFGAVEEALVFREYGRALVSVGVLGATLATSLAVRSLPEAIPGLVAGTTRVGIANPRGPIDAGETVSGEFHLIEAEGADLVVAFTKDGVGLFRAGAFTDVTEALSMDSHMRLSRARLAGVVPIVWESAKEGLLHARANLLIAAYATGVAEAALAMGVDYAKVREQFGKPIGSFQSIKHKCADMAIQSEVASCQTSFASVVLQSERPDARYHALAARIVAVDAALGNGATNIQVHGAIGFTAEIEAHLYLKRAHLIDFLGGDLRVQKAAMIRAEAPG
jgi:alkylation response protein AidB-like acyl-CoA dehydrogenase